jgi:hypothetical protein
MTANQQRIAIAKACGWTGTEEDYTFYGFTQSIPMTRTRWTNPSGGKTTLTLPDYPSDLNAMHEAEKVIIERGDEAMLDYDQELSMVTDSWKWNATAAQRASAFLETLGLWEEDK